MIGGDYCHLGHVPQSRELGENPVNSCPGWNLLKTAGFPGKFLGIGWPGPGGLAIPAEKFRGVITREGPGPRGPGGFPKGRGPIGRGNSSGGIVDFWTTTVNSQGP